MIVRACSEGSGDRPETNSQNRLLPSADGGMMEVVHPNLNQVVFACKEGTHDESQHARQLPHGVAIVHQQRAGGSHQVYPSASLLDQLVLGHSRRAMQRRARSKDEQAVFHRQSFQCRGSSEDQVIHEGANQHSHEAQETDSMARWGPMPAVKTSGAVFSPKATPGSDKTDLCQDTDANPVIGTRGII